MINFLHIHTFIHVHNINAIIIKYSRKFYSRWSNTFTSQCTAIRICIYTTCEGGVNVKLNIEFPTNTNLRVYVFLYTLSRHYTPVVSPHLLHAVFHLPRGYQNFKSRRFAKAMVDIVIKNLLVNGRWYLQKRRNVLLREGNRGPRWFSRMVISSVATDTFFLSSHGRTCRQAIFG